MNIAHLLPFSAKFPLEVHSGRYEWALNLAVAQAGQGQTVTIYAAPGSKNNNPLIKWKSLEHDLNDKDLNNAALIKAALSNQDHDIYHSHFDSLHYSLADMTDKPIVFTQHWFPSDKVAVATKLNKKNNVFAVPPTLYMLAYDNKLGIRSLGTIPHGINLNVFKLPKGARSKRLIFVGRISPVKGVLEAVKIAKAANEPLDIVGRTSEKYKNYWQEIKPLVDGDRIRYLGPKSQAEVVELLGRAKALLFPSKVPEAFGLVTIEAQACGTPVIISDVGASSELVEDGVSGFVVKTDSDYVAAIKKIKQIDPIACRKQAEKFSFDGMTKAYQTLYEKLLKESLVRINYS